MAEKSYLLKLLSSIDQFAVPTIQRDYAQGRDKGSNKDLCEEVRIGIVQTLHDALTDDKCILLDYIYGTEDSHIFYPIDGQQRLTTLFLLHWYIGKREGIDRTNAAEFNQLKKFSYEIRDTSKEFCRSLIDIDVEFDRDSISDQIKDSSKYHGAYSYDPTVLSMLTVLDAIHAKFKSTDVKLWGELWGRLKNIGFWCLSLEHFGLTDDLFVKMNARGKRLSRFDVFKSDLESMIENKGDKAGDIWKNEIDNAYLDAYWVKFGAGLSERNLFRTILFYVKMLILAKNLKSEYDDLWESDESRVNYSDVIAFIKDNAAALTVVCNLLSNFGVWEKYVSDTNLFVKNVSSVVQGKITGYKKAMVFGILHWFAYADGMSADDNFFEFKRILENYVFSSRQPNIRPEKRFYSSIIDSKNIGRAIAFLKDVIDAYDRKFSFNDYVSKSTFVELDYEREKLAYKPLKDIVELEKLPFLKTNISNYFFDGVLYLTAAQLNTIAGDEDLINKALRVIYSYAKNEYGKFSDLLIDQTLIKSGHKQLYYNSSTDQATAYMHKLAIKIDDTDTLEFGDRILTVSGNKIYADAADCVKSFVKALSAKLKGGQTVLAAIDALLAERIALRNFSGCDNIKWYIVKYEEFFYTKTGTTLSVLRRKNYGGIDDDNVYDIQCLSDDNDFNKEHYQPFYQALANKLNNRIKVSAPLRYTGVHIEYAHPCILSNGWTIRINKNGNWLIDFKGNKPLSLTEDLTIAPSGLSGELNCSGRDSIEAMAKFLNSL